MSKKTRNYEEPVDDSAEAEVEEEFRFNPERARHHVMPRGVRKVRVNIYLDDDVVAYFKARAAQPHAAPYQTQINQTLRQAMARTRAPNATAQSESATEIRRVLLTDDGFIKAVAEQVAHINRTPKGKRRQAA
jgi:uncharacterized protein (DUF4415 family)